MSRFTPQFLDEIRNRVLASSVIGRSVSWDRRKSNPAKGDFWANCCFHGEKSPSFHVDDRKGRFYCFGCHASGDIFSFLVDKEGLTFPEAVERLAGEANLKMPVASPEERHRAAVRATLHQVVDMAATWFQDQLRGTAGAQARTYLAGRDIHADVCRDFGIGYAPKDRTGLISHLQQRGITAEQMLEAGLSVKSEAAPAPYDRFRDRVMFPIRDRRGRAIAFGGRALAPDAMAKYLNSPETPIFKKGDNLYNFDRAQPAAHQLARLVVVEGYVDVIAMARAGIQHAVAPLGTAVTPEQLSLLWRTVPEPTFCFDGDGAGLKAAGRAADLVLPLLSPGHTVNFCILEEGMDPDDLLRRDGAAALRSVVTKTVSLLEFIWDRALAANDRSSPERASQFEKDLHLEVDRIADGTVRNHYRRALRLRLQDLFQVKTVRRETVQRRGNPSWRVGQPGAKLLGTLARMEKLSASSNQLRDEGCFDEEL